MALDKVIDSAVLDADLLAVADAIRAKGGTLEQLVFPEEFVSAVEAISASGGYPEKFYETDFVMDESITANGTVCTITTGLSDDLVTVGNELVMCIITCEPTVTPSKNWAKKMMQFICPNQGTIKATEFGFYVNADATMSREGRTLSNTAVGCYIYTVTTDLSTITINARFNVCGPAVGNYHLELYRLGVVV